MPSIPSIKVNNVEYQLKDSVSRSAVEEIKKTIYPYRNEIDIELLEKAGWNTNDGIVYSGIFGNLTTTFGESKGGIPFPFSTFNTDPYTLSVTYYTNSSVSSTNAGALVVEYTDGTTQQAIYFSHNYKDWRTETVFLNSGKKISKVFFRNVASVNYTFFIKDFMLIRGTEQYGNHEIPPDGTYRLSSTDEYSRDEIDKQLKINDFIVEPVTNLIDADELLKANGWTKQNDVYSGKLMNLTGLFGYPGGKYPTDNVHFEENMQYTLTVEFRTDVIGGSGNGAYFRAHYTDGTQQALIGFDLSLRDWTTRVMYSTEDKTIDFISIDTSTASRDNVWYIRNLALYKGNVRKSTHTPQPAILPYEKTAIDKIARESIDAMGLFVIPSYYTNYADAIANARNDIGKAGFNGFSFIFSTDQHWESKTFRVGLTAYTPAIIYSALKTLNIHTLVLGGDLIDGGNGVTHDEALRRLNEAFKAYNIADTVLYVRGNHDGNDVGQRDATALLSQKDLFGCCMQQLIGKATLPDNYESFGRYLPYYYDIPFLKTRCIVIDTGIEVTNMDQTQLDWIQDTLDSTPSNYHIILFAHQVCKRNDEGEIEYYMTGLQIKAIADAFNAESTGAKIVGIIGGHCHKDASTFTETGIPIVITDTDSLNTNPVQLSMPMTVTDACVDIITFNYTEKRINCRRIGRGEDRVMTWQY